MIGAGTLSPGGKCWVGRTPSFSWPWCGRPSNVRPCADSTVADKFCVVAFFPFGVWPFSLLVWGRGCPKFYRAGRPLPPYQSARKSPRKLPKSKDYQPKVVLHNVRYDAFQLQADCRRAGRYRLAGGRVSAEYCRPKGKCRRALFTRNRQSLFCGGSLLTNASLILLALIL